MSRSHQRHYGAMPISNSLGALRFKGRVRRGPSKCGSNCASHEPPTGDLSSAHRGASTSGWRACRGAGAGSSCIFARDVAGDPPKVRRARGISYRCDPRLVVQEQREDRVIPAQRQQRVVRTLTGSLVRSGEASGDLRPELRKLGGARRSPPSRSEGSKICRWIYTSATAPSARLSAIPARGPTGHSRRLAFSPTS